ncbi:MAG: VWA domain-containing protein [Pirellulaceae bacterium]|jgi:DNA-directed RNA polymerase subunit RPC12/RpoP/Mg-chelatase subunit ChlD|nr:VWA domain-containing protein [Pirellulaceae bacterium]
MNLLCVKCGRGFSVSEEQFGTRGKCPHCKATILVPKFRTSVSGTTERIQAPSQWLDKSLAIIITSAVHIAVFLLLTLVPWNTYHRGTIGVGDDVQVGALPKPKSLTSHLRDLQISVDDIPLDRKQLNEMLASSFSLQATSETVAELSRASLAAGAESDGRVQDLVSPLATSEYASGQEAFTELIARIRKEGLDIAIVFDSTGSMGGEINQLKSRISEIGRVLFQLVPETRISICTYRDHGSEYLVQGVPLTNNLGELVGFLSSIQAAGGGDDPEAVDEGIRWAVENNEFRPNSRKVILIFGDAPPHSANQIDCLKMATEFRRGGGIVSTITCRRPQTLKEFEEISRLGGGEAFLTEDHHQLMSRLMVLVFGSKHQEKVLELFKLLEK